MFSDDGENFGVKCERVECTFGFVLSRGPIVKSVKELFGTFVEILHDFFSGPVGVSGCLNSVDTWERVRGDKRTFSCVVVDSFVVV